MSSEREILTIDGHEVAISNPRKVLFPQAGHTKLDLVRYYLAVADGALRGAGGRPNVLVRYPNGIDGEFFYQKRAPAVAARLDRGGGAAVSVRPHAPRRWCRAMPRRSPGWPTSPASSCIRTRCAPRTSIIPTSCASTSIRCRASSGRRFARWRGVVRATLDDFGLVGWPKTSGSRGIHINVRIERRWTFDEVRRAALALAREVERRAPALATSKWWKEERHGVFLDYNQNAKDRTVAAAYSVRPKPDARVSAPLTWDEIDDCDPGDFTLATMPARFAAIGDRHAGDRRASVLARSPARIVGASRAGGPRRRAVAAALPEAGRRAAARAAVARGACSKHPLIEIGRAQRRTMRSPGSSAGRRAIRSGRAPRTGRRAGRCHAGPVSHLDAHPRQPAARARGAAAAQEALDPDDEPND